MLFILIGMSADTFLCVIFSFCRGAGFFIVSYKNGVTVELATINISVFLFFFAVTGMRTGKGINFVII